MTRVPDVVCDVCGKPTTRLFGFAAVIDVSQGAAETLTRFRSSARGYCLAHKDQILPRFMADAEGEGEVLWQAPEPEMLRPAGVPDFQGRMDLMALEVGRGVGLDPSAVRREVHLQAAGEETDLPTACPHCRGRLSWGTGPHVREASERQGLAEAWECLDCRAAGMLTGR